MRTRKTVHRKSKYLWGFLLTGLPIVVFVFSYISFDSLVKKVTSKINNIQPETWGSNQDTIISIGLISFCLIVILSVALIYSRRKVRQLLKIHKQLMQRQHQELTLVARKLNASEEQLKVHDVAKEKFLSIISKDLKSPLLALKSYAYTLKTKDGNFSPWELTSYATSLQKSLDHVIGVLNHVSRWSMVQDPFQPSQIDNININKMIAYTLRLMKPSADKKRIALLKNINCKVEIMGDAHMVEFILRNLVSNAIKFSNEGSVVMVKLRAEEDFLIISVKDQGIGMSEETLTRLFCINENAGANDSGKPRETGLGLVLCKEFLQKLGGTISVQSKPNEGSLFTVSLPKSIHHPSKLMGQ